MMLLLTHLRANWAQMQECNEELAEKRKLCAAWGDGSGISVAFDSGIDGGWSTIHSEKEIYLSHTQLAVVEC